MWTLEEGVEAARRLEAAVAPCGYAVGMTGSVLLRGESRNDLDLVVYPRSTAKLDEPALRAALAGFGLELVVSREKVTAHWRKEGSLDEKHVEVFRLRPPPGRVARKRIDVFFLR